MIARLLAIVAASLALMGTVSARMPEDCAASIYTPAGYVCGPARVIAKARARATSYADAVYVDGVYYAAGVLQPDPWRGPQRRARAEIEAMVSAAAMATAVPVHIAHAVVRLESGYKAHVRGRAGEYGLGQIKCHTARSVGFTGACRQLYDPETNLRYSMRYLRLALDRGGVGYYNAGIHARRLPVGAVAYARKVAVLAGRRP